MEDIGDVRLNPYYLDNVIGTCLDYLNDGLNAKTKRKKDMFIGKAFGALYAIKEVMETRYGDEIDTPPERE